MRTPGHQPSSGMCSHSSLISTPLICPSHASPVPGYHKGESGKQLKYTVSRFWGCQPVLDPSNCRVKRKSLHFLLASTNQPCSLILRLNHSHFSYLHMTLTMSVSLSVLFLFKKNCLKFCFYVYGYFFLWEVSTEAQRRTPDVLGLEFQMVGSHHVSAGNWPWVLWKESQGSYPPSHLSSSPSLLIRTSVIWDGDPS